MPNMNLNAADRGRTVDESADRVESRKKELFELAVFLLLIVPSMLISFPGLGGSLGFPLLAVSVIFRDLSLTCLVVFFLWRDGVSLSRLGWTRAGLKQEALLGVALFVPILYGIAILKRVFEWVGLSGVKGVPQFLMAKGPLEIVLACVLVVVVAVAEETIFRGYLILRFNQLTGSIASAILLSSAVFSLGHGYEGTAGLGTVGVLGVILALVYLWRKSLVAPVVLHFLIDFFPLVLLPLLKIK
ncbi:MAG: CPBP family intramembrane glutamic endopeptidase [Syntrophobacteraceae bacterium]